jgi:hypothetical protein
MPGSPRAVRVGQVDSDELGIAIAAALRLEKTIESGLAAAQYATCAAGCAIRPMAGWPIELRA